MAQSLPLIVLLFLAMWLFVIRPQRRRQSVQKRMLDQIGPGAEVLTAGGVYGTVRSVDDEDVRVEIAPGVEVKMARRAIAAVVTEPEPDGTDELKELERLQQQAQDEVQTVSAGDPSKP